jgi:hypothetical protein
MSEINETIEKELDINKSAEDKEVSDLSSEKQKLEKALNEERFIWIISFIILLDILFLKDCSTLSLPIIIGLFELIIILILGEKFNVKLLTLLIDKILHTFKREEKANDVSKL